MFLTPAPLSEGPPLLLSVFTQQLEILVTSLGTPLFGLNKDVLVSFVQRVDNTMHWINVYPLNDVIGFLDTYPLDSDLSGG